MEETLRSFTSPDGDVVYLDPNQVISVGVSVKRGEWAVRLVLLGGNDNAAYRIFDTPENMAKLSIFKSER